MEFEKMSNVTVESLMKRIDLFIEDDEWEKAEEYIEQVINMDPENGNAYFKKIFIEYRAKNESDLIMLYSKKRCILEENKNFKYVHRFGEKELVEKINFISNQIKEEIKKIDEEELETLYNNTISRIPTATEINEFDNIIKILEKLGDYKDSKKEINKLKEKSDKIKQEIKEKEEKIKNTTIKYIKKFLILISSIIIIVVVSKFTIRMCKEFLMPKLNYFIAEINFKNQNYEEALWRYRGLKDYRDSKEKAVFVLNEYAEYLLDNKEFEKAINILNMKNEEITSEIKYKYANYLMEKNEEKAYEIFKEIEDYQDTKEKSKQLALKIAKKYEEKKSYVLSYEWYVKGNAENTGLENLYTYVNSNKDRKNENTYIFLKILTTKNYKNSQEIYNELYKKSIIVTLNNDTENTTHSKYGKSDRSIIVHYKVSGLYPGETYKAKIRYENKLDYRNDSTWASHEIEINYEEDDTWKNFYESSGSSVAWSACHVYEYDPVEKEYNKLVYTSDKITY